LLTLPIRTLYRCTIRPLELITSPQCPVVEVAGGLADSPSRIFPRKTFRSRPEARGDDLLASAPQCLGDSRRNARHSFQRE
jgi:hypothetical protein